MRINTFNHNTDDIMDSADNYEDIYEEIRLDPYTQLPFARNNNNNMPEIHKNVMTVQSIQHNTLPNSSSTATPHLHPPQVSSYSRAKKKDNKSVLIILSSSFFHFPRLFSFSSTFPLQQY